MAHTVNSQLSGNATSLWHPSMLSAFIGLTLIWSLTPLAIVVSISAMHPLWGFALRFILAAPIAHAVLRMQGLSLTHSKLAYTSYAAGALGTTGGMLLTYLAAPHLPSGIISMLFGLSPITAGIVGLLYYKQPLHTLQWVGMLLALLGLGVVLGVFGTQVHYPWVALLLVIGAMLLYVLSTYIVIALKADVAPLVQTTGTLWISFLVVFPLMPLLLDNIPSVLPSLPSILAIAFLVFASSIGGFMLYFKLIHTIGATSTALITVITPVIAIFFGWALYHEGLHTSTFVGLAVIVIGLALYLRGQILGSTA